jgi:hypothetical protein
MQSTAMTYATWLALSVSLFHFTIHWKLSTHLYSTIISIKNHLFTVVLQLLSNLISYFWIASAIYFSIPGYVLHRDGIRLLSIESSWILSWLTSWWLSTLVSLLMFSLPLPWWFTYTANIRVSPSLPLLFICSRPSLLECSQWIWKVTSIKTWILLTDNMYILWDMLGSSIILCIRRIQSHL